MRRRVSGREPRFLVVGHAPMILRVVTAQVNLARDRLPGMVLRQMLATSAAELPIGPEWTYEVKWDGYRALAIKDDARVQLVSRNQKDLTRDYPAIAAAVGRLPASSFVLDGEILALDAERRPSPRHCWAYFRPSLSQRLSGPPTWLAVAASLLVDIRSPSRRPSEPSPASPWEVRSAQDDSE
jgi:hypothetical protein